MNNKGFAEILTAFFCRVAVGLIAFTSLYGLYTLVNNLDNKTEKCFISNNLNSSTLIKTIKETKYGFSAKLLINNQLVYVSKDAIKTNAFQVDCNAFEPGNEYGL